MRRKREDSLEEGVRLSSQIALELLRQTSLSLNTLEDSSPKALKEMVGVVKSLQDMLETEVDIRRKQLELEMSRRRMSEGETEGIVRVILGEAEEYAE